MKAREVLRRTRDKRRHDADVSGARASDLRVAADAIEIEAKRRDGLSRAAERRWHDMGILGGHFGADPRLLQPVAATARWVIEDAGLRAGEEVRAAREMIHEVCSWASDEEIDTAIDTCGRWTASRIARHLGVTWDLRQRLGLRLRAVSDMPLADFLERLKTWNRERRRADAAAKRRSAKRPTREQRQEHRARLMELAAVHGVSERTIRRRETRSVKTRDVVEREILRHANCHAGVSQALAVLGISRATLYRRARRQGLSVKAYVSSLGLAGAAGLEGPAASPTLTGESSVVSFHPGPQNVAGSVARHIASIHAPVVDLSAVRAMAKAVQRGEAVVVELGRRGWALMSR